jgi:hypothetical protein
LGHQRNREQLIDRFASDRMLETITFWADRIPNINPRADGVSNGLTGASVDLFNSAMTETRKAAGIFYDMFIDTAGRATC